MSVCGAAVSSLSFVTGVNSMSSGGAKGRCLVVSLYDTHEAETLGHDSYPTVTVGLTTGDATDTQEADTL
jgi:hypothetical protein